MNVHSARRITFGSLKLLSSILDDHFEVIHASRGVWIPQHGLDFVVKNSESSLSLIGIHRGSGAGIFLPCSRTVCYLLAVIDGHDEACIGSESVGHVSSWGLNSAYFATSVRVTALSA